MKNEGDPTVKFYQEWLSHVEDKSFLIYYDISYSYLLSFHLLTGMTRKYNSDHIMAAQQFVPNLFPLQHLKYQ